MDATDDDMEDASSTEMIVSRRSFELGGGIGVGLCVRYDGTVFALVLKDESRLSGVWRSSKGGIRASEVDLGDAGERYACTMFGKGVAVAIDDRRWGLSLDVGSHSNRVEASSKLFQRSASARLVGSATLGESTVCLLFEDGSVRVEEKEQGDVWWVRSSCATSAISLAATDDDDELCVGNEDGSFRLVCISGRNYRRRLECGIDAGVVAMVAAGRRRLLASHSDGTLVFWELEAGVPLATWRLGQDLVITQFPSIAFGLTTTSAVIRLCWRDDALDTVFRLDELEADETAAMANDVLVGLRGKDMWVATTTSSTPSEIVVEDTESTEESELSEFRRLLTSLDRADSQKHLAEFFGRLRNAGLSEDASRAGMVVARANFTTAESARGALDVVSSALSRADAPDAAVAVVAEIREKLETYEELREVKETRWKTEEWIRFRDADAFDTARVLAEAGDLPSLVVVWRRQLASRCFKGGAVSRSAASERFAMIIANSLSPSLGGREAAAWLCDSVVPVLRGASCFSKIACWAILATRLLAGQEGRTDEALEVAEIISAALEAPLSVGTIASGATADAWLASDANINDDDSSSSSLLTLQALARKLRRVVDLRDGAKFSTTLANYEATTDKASIAIGLLERVRESTLLGKEIEKYVRPVCETHRINADDLLLDYVREMPSEDADRGAAIVRELRGERNSRRRVRASLALVAASCPPYPSAILRLAEDFENEWKSLAVDGDDEASRLQDAIRIARLTTVAHAFDCEDFDPGEPAQARRLASIVVTRAAHHVFWDNHAGEGGGMLAGDDEALDSFAVLAKAYPATLSIRTAVVSLVSKLSRRSGDAVDARTLGLMADAVTTKWLPSVSDRQSARREIVVSCRRSLEDGEDCDRFRTAAIGAAVGQSLVEDNARNDDDNELSRKASTFGHRLDAKAVDELRRLAALYEEFSLFEATPSVARHIDARMDLLERAATPLVEKAAALDVEDETARAKLERLAELMDAPGGWTAAALAAKAQDGRFADELFVVGEENSGKASALRGLAMTLLNRAKKDVALLDNRDSWRTTALRSLAMAAAVEPRSDRVGKDLDAIENLRYLRAVAARCMGGGGGQKNDGLLLNASVIQPMLLGLLREDANDDHTATENVVDAFAKSKAWRLASKVLRLRSVRRHADGEPHFIASERAAYVAQLRSWLVSYSTDSKDELRAALDAEMVSGLAVAAPRACAVDAYREILGAAHDLSRLKDLANLGRVVAASLDDPRLQETCASLAIDAAWWKLLSDRKVAFNHSKLTRGNEPSGECSAYARSLVVSILDSSATKLPASDLDLVVAFCRRYGVDETVAGEAAAVRFLARGVAGDAEDNDAAVTKALGLVAKPERELAVLRAAVVMASPRAYDRIDASVVLLLDKTPSHQTEVVGSSPFATPSRDTLEHWRRLLRWLKRVRLDPTAALGAEAVRAIEQPVDGSSLLGFHDLVSKPLETLEPVLTEESAPMICRVVSKSLPALEPAALWVRLAELARERDDHRGAGLEMAWRCLDRAAQTSLPLACRASLDVINSDHFPSSSALEATTRAYKLAARWAAVDTSSTARAMAHDMFLRVTREARLAVSAAFVPRWNASSDERGPEIFDDDSTDLVLRKLYTSAAERAAEYALRGIKPGSRRDLRLAARRAHAAASILARFEAHSDDVAENARRELAKTWLYDVQQDGDATSTSTVFSPTALELREARMAACAVKVAFVLSARDSGREEFDREGDDEDDTLVDIASLETHLAVRDGLADSQEQHQLVPVDSDQAVEKQTAVELLVELAATTGGPGDEAIEASSHGADNFVEAGHRQRLTARVRLRALRAAAVLSPSRAVLRAAWALVAPDDDEEGKYLTVSNSPVTLVALSRRLRVVSELSAMRIPLASVIAARGVACDNGVRAVVTTLLRDHCSQVTAPDLLPLLAALLLEADDESPMDTVDVADIELWFALLETFVSFQQWRSLLSILRRLCARPWIHTDHANKLRPIWASALRQPANELRDIIDRKRKPRPLWESNKSISMHYSRKAPSTIQLPAKEEVVAIFQEVVAIVLAVPRFVEDKDRKHIANALKVYGGLEELAQAVQKDAHELRCSSDPTLLLSTSRQHRLPRLSL